MFEGSALGNCKVANANEQYGVDGRVPGHREDWGRLLRGCHRLDAPRGRSPVAEEVEC